MTVKIRDARKRVWQTTGFTSLKKVIPFLLKTNPKFSVVARTRDSVTVLWHDFNCISIYKRFRDEKK